MPTIHLLIKGKVQGVSFRYYAMKMAREIGLMGWVKNTEEGHVEAMATGPEEALQKFNEWCKHGPRQAKVAEVILTSQKEIAFSGFVIEY